MTLFSVKILFSIDAYVVWCPTWSKNLGTVSKQYKGNNRMGARAPRSVSMDLFPTYHHHFPDLPCTQPCVWWHLHKYIFDIDDKDSLFPKICNKCRKHLKSFVSFQPSGKTGLIWAVCTENICNFTKVCTLSMCVFHLFVAKQVQRFLA